ncbi:MAG: ADP-ribosylglycohydrolase family protein, partial [Alicyclobacillus sp.]|nr:ADP-ribosylglycohydrolase family protein [Alicyclobacillus sp.]
NHPEDRLEMCGTDDTEFAVVIAKILCESSEHPTLDELFAGWKKYVVDHGDAIWSGISERASIENARKGLTAPDTGSDNPHHFDDGAVARAVPVGLKYHGRPELAADVAGKMASVTNAEDGIWAAQAMAASIAVAVSGAPLREVMAAGMRFIPEDSWLCRKVNVALELLNQAGSGFAAVPLWNKHVVNGLYNFGNVAPVTLAVAYAVFKSTEGRLLEGLQLAALIPKQSDSMPAMVGALAGAMQGVSSVPRTWIESLDTLKGVCVKHLAGVSVCRVVDDLMQ